MSRLIALVATAVMVDGVRTVVEAGQELPELTRHDARELVNNGLAMDPEKQAANEKAKKSEEAAALKTFREAREKVQAAQESIQPDAEDAAKAEGPDAEKAKPAAKTASTKKN